jgi:hypothetical protein
LLQYRTDSVGNLLPAWARLGPLSMEDNLANASIQTVDRDSFRDRSPNGVA